ncbi:MFS transporter [Flavimobilis marinus]|uniref:MFS transporter, sugar porter (SP) family n=1 Tax=Flavimobilis marinus TaxID=285351 RepID=A0A1I2H2B2_9MICO|nr:sugar porter family MFS transporter [Flavimobilis marinus]GHG54707.1 MFS transporter [Flavimobilis marinus]SFF22956.1 MFS transporter, sugar porter (SP) family [Flavimobilis marinus]
MSQVEVRKGHRRAILLSVSAAVGGFLFGFDSSVINGAVDAIETDFELSATVTGFAVAVALLGCALGAWYAGRLADRFGRPRVMLIGALLFLVSAIGSGFAFGVWDLVLWRVVGGIGVGIASVITPAYIAEISPTAVRGRLASLQQLAITFGILVALLSDQLFALTADDVSSGSPIALGASLFGLEAWRWMLLIEVLPALLYVVVALRVPESPRYLVMANRDDEAVVVLRTVLGPVDVDAKVASIRESVDRDAKLEKSASLKGSRFGLLPIVWVGIILSVFQQFVGINVIFYYSTTLWRSVGFDDSDSFTFSTITAVTNVVVTFIAIALIDKIGRKPLLLAGSAGMTLSLITMAVAFTQASGTGEDVSLPAPWGTIALIAANLFVVSFGASWGPVVWVLLGEMFPNRIRASALALAAAAQWIANFTITVSFPPLAENLGLPFVYAMYGTFAGLSFLFVWAKVKETRHRELEDMRDDG